MMDVQAMYAACVQHTADFVHAAGFDEVVIGLSGGIDSSLVAVMAADALGPHRVHGVLMPGPYSSEGSLTDAHAVAERVGISTLTVPITEPYAAFAQVLTQATGEPFDGLAAENTQARCRMVVLMALANARGWMMLNTGNKSEAAMGYSTLYGDTAGAFAPLGGVYKTQVYELCAWRNQQAEALGKVPPIPRGVIEKPPSAELAPDQSDEASLGIDYATLDRILVQLVEHGRSADEVVAAGFSQDQVREVAQRYTAYAFKRALEPPFPDVDFYA